MTFWQEKSIPKHMLTDIEKKILASLQGDIPIVANPYEILAKEIGISEEEFITTLQSLCDRKIIRRFGATLRHQKSGFSANAMGAWVVPEDRIEEVGQLMAQFSEVTHCYRRNPTLEFPYNMYTMIHGSSEENCHETARRVSEKTKISTYTLLFSRKELKKTSMSYFLDEDD